MSPRSIEEVLEAHNTTLLKIRGVVGTAIGLCDGAPCIRVLVTEAEVARRYRFPKRLEGYPLVIDVSGPIEPRQRPT